jgi:DNA-binding NarL/FixJ family response regulator
VARLRGHPGRGAVVTIRVLLVDDQELVREGLRRILHSSEGFEIVGECDDGEGVVPTVKALQPDVVVLDIRMRRVDGIEAIRQLRLHDDSPPILVLTTFGEDEILSGALRAGASGFQLKDAPGEDLIRATQAVARGDGWLDPSVTARVLHTYRADPREAREQPDIEQLTPREREVLRLIGTGATNAEIARTLVVSELTVKSHIGRIFTKLGLRDRAQAIVYAFDTGLVRPERP